MTAVTGTLLDSDEVALTADAIAACQQTNGLILWFDGHHADVWNHTEAAMALTVAGRHAEAEAAFEWLSGAQLGPTHTAGGAWHNYYTANGISEAQYDTNCCAYVATGVWHRYLATGDIDFARAMWPTVKRALSWVLSTQRPNGHVPWAVHADGKPWSYSLLTGTCSVAMSLRCGAALGELVGDAMAQWDACATQLAHLAATRPHEFEPKQRWAMDWYYPVLTGVLTGEAARRHLRRGERHFFQALHAGVRCVADKPWVTTAETAEAAMAYARAGLADTAHSLLAATASLRQPDGSYRTGVVLPEGNSFPHNEHTSYSAAAVLLATDALRGLTPAHGLLAGAASSPATAPAAAPATAPDHGGDSSRSTRRLPQQATSANPSESARR